MQKRFKYLGNRLVILSMMGIAVNTPLGNFSSPQSFKEGNTGNTVSLSRSSLTITNWVIGARDDRQRECRFLGICDT